MLLSYVTVLRHIRRSRRSTSIQTSRGLLARVLRNIIVIQVVITVCLLPYYIFKPIFNSVVHEQHQLTSPPHNSSAPGVHTIIQCHPFSFLIELKNCLVLLATLRSSIDPVVYFLLDKTFRHLTLRLFRCTSKTDQDSSPDDRMSGANQRTEKLGVGTETPTADLSHERVCSLE
ncbi:hypothetical protein LDENG_00011370 [Lucifuga dentata]|nr:hypothetical protein LDENG_00011370 [Lucifuga dentata]